MKKRPLLLLALVAALAGCASRPSVSAEAQRFRGWVERLADPAMEGRGAGYEGLDKARDTLVAAFREAKLKPAFVGRSYTQAIDITLRTKATAAQLAWRLNDKAHALDAGSADDFTVLGFSGSGAFAGDAVFVGYAIGSAEHDYDSLAGRDDLLRGRVAVAYRYEPMDEAGRSRWGPDGAWTDAASLVSKAQWAQTQGAVALVLVDPPARDLGGSLRATAQATFDQSVDIPVFHLRAATLARMLRAIGRDADSAMRAWQQYADAGRHRPELLDGLRIAGEACVEHGSATIHNVAAIVPGRGVLADESIVVGAHYDHLGHGEVASRSGEDAVHPGADDNASGVAAMMMLARRWARHAAHDDSPDRRTLVFVGFSGEERGLAGSAHFVTRTGELNFDLKQTVAMVNLDMVGRLRDDRLTVMGLSSSAQWPALIDRANARTRLEINTVPFPIGPSDHTSFYLARIPAIHLFTGMHEDYHRPTDAAWKINAPGGAKVVDFADALLAELACGAPVELTETNYMRPASSN